MEFLPKDPAILVLNVRNNLKAAFQVGKGKM